MQKADALFDAIKQAPKQRVALPYNDISKQMGFEGFMQLQKQLQKQLERKRHPLLAPQTFKDSAGYTRVRLAEDLKIPLRAAQWACEQFSSQKQPKDRAIELGLEYAEGIIKRKIYEPAGFLNISLGYTNYLACAHSQAISKTQKQDIAAALSAVIIEAETIAGRGDLLYKYSQFDEVLRYDLAASFAKLSQYVLSAYAGFIVNAENVPDFDANKNRLKNALKAAKSGDSGAIMALALWSVGLFPQCRETPIFHPYESELLNFK